LALWAFCFFASAVLFFAAAFLSPIPEPPQNPKDEQQQHSYRKNTSAPDEF